MDNDKRQEPDPDKIVLPEFDYPEYPNWSRGLKWGLCGGIPAALPASLMLFFRSESLLFRIFCILAISIVVFLIVGSIGAFRPDSDKK